MRQLNPGMFWSFLLLVIFIGLQTALSVPAMMVGGLTGEGPRMHVGWLAVINSAAFVGTVLLARLVTKKPWRELLNWRPARGGLWPAIVPLALGMGVIVIEMYNLTCFALPMPEFVAELMSEMLALDENPVLATLALVVVAPITEEFVCRRWLLASLLERWSPARSILVSALAFGAMHMNPWQFFYASTLGLGLGWIYWRTRSVVLCILWHALHNGLSTVLYFWRPDVPGLRGEPGGPVEFNPWWLNLAALVIIAVGAGWVWSRTNPKEFATVAPPPLPSQLPPSLPPREPTS